LKQGYSILIVDDEPDLCWVLKTLLEKQGFVTMQAVNGQEALSLMAPKRFHSIFLDAKLPDVEGLDLAVQLRSIDPSLRIVMISGYFYLTDDAITKAVSTGVLNGFISKPFIHDEVLRMINPPSVDLEKGDTT